MGNSSSNPQLAENHKKELATETGCKINIL